MTLNDKLGMVDLAAAGGYENRDEGVPRLCIPALTLQDGPNGIAHGARGVTQLPASLGIAASFDTSLAYRYGQVEGQEARGKGIDVVQGPELNLDRVPQSGRAFEAYGEDPYLTAALGVADIEGIQSEGVMADAKHYTAYNQETARFLVNELVSPRALAEVYQVPFEAAVEQGQVASIMCAYGTLDSVNDCSSPYLYQALSSWDFTGFVRSDLNAVQAPVRAFAAGLSMIKPDAGSVLRAAVLQHQLTMSSLDDAVRRVLTEMFAFGMIEHPRTGRVRARVTTRAHALFARQAAESSIVLLKDYRGALPLDAKRLRSVAVIGADAGRATMSAGHGSAQVRAPYVVTPLAALKVALGRRVKVVYCHGGGAALQLPPVPEGTLFGPSEPSNGLGSLDASGAGPEGDADFHELRVSAVTPLVATASAEEPGRNWSTWKTTIVPQRSGLYALSLTQFGDTWLRLAGRLVMASPGLHAPAPWSATVHLRAGRRYALRLTWYAATPNVQPVLGMAYESGAIAAAVKAARSAGAAVVFANDFNSEAVDRPSLSLPGDQNALITAVAAANPRTIVVLNTGGPVLMPWLSKVAAVVEAWYPGQEGGNAVAAVLTGEVDPSGHLPVTFPASADQSPVHTSRQWPGHAAAVSYSEGLYIGYRYYVAHDLRPLFPFGFGLSYTTFSLDRASVTASRTGYAVEVRARNDGRCRGATVVQAYVSYPPGYGEPARQLRAFARVTLAPGQSKTVTMVLPRTDFEAYPGGRPVSPPGLYTLALGQSSEDLPIVLHVVVGSSSTVPESDLAGLSHQLAG
jgi:beta-glucosidase